VGGSSSRHGGTHHAPRDGARQGVAGGKALPKSAVPGQIGGGTVVGRDIYFSGVGWKTTKKVAKRLP
jgi:hypothetical protein